MLHFDSLTIAGLIAVLAVAVFLIHNCITQGCSRRDCHGTPK